MIKAMILALLLAGCAGAPATGGGVRIPVEVANQGWDRATVYESGIRLGDVEPLSRRVLWIRTPRERYHLSAALFAKSAHHELGSLNLGTGQRVRVVLKAYLPQSTVEVR